jgi:hypothetical protein
MEMCGDLAEGNHHEQALNEEDLSKVARGGIWGGAKNLITKQQFGKSAAAVLGATLTDYLVPGPGQKPLWEPRGTDPPAGSNLGM